MNKKLADLIMSYSLIFVKAKDLFFQAYSALNRRPLYIVYVFFFFVIYFLVTYISLDKIFALDDHFFHIRFAELLRDNGSGALTNFQSIYFSRMGMEQEYLVYYNFLFYLALIPFTFIDPLVLGIKIYGVLALSVSFSIVYFFLKRLFVKAPFLWTFIFLLVLLQSTWIIRFTLARPFTLAPAFLILILYFIYVKKYRLLAVTSFLYFFWHTATFIFPFCLTLGYFLFEQFYGKKPDWKLIGWSFGGTFVAVFLTYLISPGVIAYLRDVIFPVFYDTTLTKTTKIAEGAEVYGSNFFTVVTSFFWILVVLFISTSYEILRYVQTKRGLQNKEDEADLTIQPLRVTLFVASLVFLAATFLSARFLDYFVYFCLLYIAISVTDAVRFFKISGELFRKAFWSGLAISFLFLFVNLSLNFYDSLAKSRSHLIVQAPAEWLNSNIEQGKIIFNVEWDSFPTLYYFTGDKFRYVTGLEPRFLYDLDPKLYWIWSNIGSGIYCEADDCSAVIELRKGELAHEEKKKIWHERQGDLIADAVLTNFKTDIIVASVGRKDLLAVMDNSKRFEKKFFDNQNSLYAVYQIKEKK